MSRGRVTALLAVALIAGLVAIELATSGGGSRTEGGRAAPALPTNVLTPPRVTRLLISSCREGTLTVQVSRPTILMDYLPDVPMRGTSTHGPGYFVLSP